MKQLSQYDTPIHQALEEQKHNRLAHFDVPGHKGGRGNKELKHFLGEECMRLDMNSMKPLDNLCHPVSVIKDAQRLAAEAFGADEAFFIVNGTTAAVQAMIMSSCKAGDKVIMPRNVHRSAINALVVCGAIPVYINPGTNKQLGIPLGMSVQDVETTILENPDAKAILVNNPTYYGICSNLREIVRIAHQHNMLVLVDEAHGTHFYFHEGLPVSAMEAGADMAAVSMHKTGGSLTQSSILLTKNSVNGDYVRQVINLTQTTSASYLLLSSLDIARKNMYLNGNEAIAKTIYFADYARNEINKLGGYYAFAEELVDGDTVYAFDTTKLSIFTRDIGLAGIEVYDLLRDDYGIQIEFGDVGNILAIISSGDRNLEIERLISALSEIKRLHEKDKAGLFDHEYVKPNIVMAPQKAFYSQKKSVPLKESNGMVCGEFVMCYPPGIPILAPGELITEEVLRYILYAKEKGCFMTGTEDMKIENINVVEG
ncbi:aminotransferase class I/II-fold pyridoxal phosphate-dependent enzyme [Anaeromicropila populeti]|uniref:Arginine decarboxylase n=1 Tax=Anaeromicropila populeti TaxID=37658 RepID=A0A1I6LUU5_9FIRM|nr:aminotransferase class I/II-fold pyridoxal phosphate-dependent enzyme [Anaeromicropila populeti]SFS07140.1 arginine decarboxylase [Anaeromicropila populeti]